MRGARARRLGAYEEIKRRIVDLDYAPGAKLSEARIALELGQGRSPIRSAFSRLQSEGWIAVSPQSGTYVRALTEAEIVDILDARLVLEAHVTRLAALRMEESSLRQLHLTFRRLSRSGPLDSPEAFDEFTALDSQFHAAVHQAGGNALIGEMLQGLLEKVRWIKRLYPSTPGRIKTAYREIASVLSAIEARDPDLAARRMQEHIGNAAEFAAWIRRGQVRPPRSAAPRARGRRKTG